MIIVLITYRTTKLSNMSLVIFITLPVLITYRTTKLSNRPLSITLTKDVLITYRTTKLSNLKSKAESTYKPTIATIDNATISYLSIIYKYFAQVFCDNRRHFEFLHFFR